MGIIFSTLKRTRDAFTTVATVDFQIIFFTLAAALAYLETNDEPLLMYGLYFIIVCAYTYFYNLQCDNYNYRQFFKGVLNLIFMYAGYMVAQFIPIINIILLVPFVGPLAIYYVLLVCPFVLLTIMAPFDRIDCKKKQ